VNNTELDWIPVKSLGEVLFFYAEPQGYKHILQCRLNGENVILNVDKTHNTMLGKTSELRNEINAIISPDQCESKLIVF